MRSFSGLSLPATALAMVAAAWPLVGCGCGKVNQLKGAKAYKAANAAYQTQDYKKAADLYQETVDADPTTPRSRPPTSSSATASTTSGSRARRATLRTTSCSQDAVKNYQIAADKLMASDNPEYKKFGKLALQYLVAAYGTEKLNDAGKAEPILQHMIQLESGRSGELLHARQAVRRRRRARRSRADVHRRQGRQAERPGGLHEPRRALQPLGPVRQDDRRARTACREGTRQPRGVPDDRELLLGQGEQGFAPERRREERLRRSRASRRSIDALQIKPDYAEGMVYKGLLLRLQANLEKDPAKQQAADQGSRSSCTTRPRRSARRRPPAQRSSSPRALRPFGFEAVGQIVRRPFFSSALHTATVKLPAASTVTSNSLQEICNES